MGVAYERGLLLYRQRRYAQAADEFRRELSADTGHADAHAMLGMSLLYANDRAGAEAEIGEAVRLAPDRAYGHYAMASLALRRPSGGRLGRAVGRHPDAVRRRTRAARPHVEQAVRLDPWNAEYFGLLAAVEFDLGDWAAAEAAARRGLAVRPSHDRCATLLARAMAAAGRPEAADAVLTGVLSRNPGYAPAHLARGWLALDGGDVRGATDHIRESLRLDPTQANARAALRRARWARVPVVGALVRGVRRLERRSRQLTPSQRARQSVACVAAVAVATGLTRLGHDGTVNAGLLAGLATGCGGAVVVAWVLSRAVARRRRSTSPVAESIRSSP